MKATTNACLYPPLLLRLRPPAQQPLQLRYYTRALVRKQMDKRAQQATTTKNNYMNRTNVHQPGTAANPAPPSLKPPHVAESSTGPANIGHMIHHIHLQTRRTGIGR